MNLNEELKTILRCKKLLSEAYSVRSGEEIEFIRNGHTYMYFAITSPYKETRYYRIDESLDTYQLNRSKWLYSMTI
ncbi:hypothetical protein BK732_07465 [Bacillus thuringiensis serovar navarrensis]|uniref:Uncharacterized protein n=1 Tax=Bacillus thuringiensis serovar navarrensis TaxID=339658 RepID=A0A243ALN0_BACTU|nr:hypothetical protein BK732_07465 [Bacillus thuringiensis serovar navarrensis]